MREVSVLTTLEEGVNLTVPIPHMRPSCSVNEELKKGGVPLRILRLPMQVVRPSKSGQGDSDYS